MATVITIKNTQNEVVADISSKEILKDVVSVALIGRGAESYIEDFNQNFVKILENLANETAPEDPMIGQMWYDKKDKSLKLFNGVNWGYNVSKIGGKSLQEIKDWVLGYLDLSDKFDKVGGTINGAIVTNQKFSTSGNIVPTKNEVYDLGSYTKRFKTLFIREKSIFLGDKGLYHISKNSFIYTVTTNEADVSKIPIGVIILNSVTGIAVVKRSIGTFGPSNAKFGQLMYDINNAVRLGTVVKGFLGDRQVFGRGYHCGWAPAQYHYVQITTPMDTRYFGNTRDQYIAPIGVTGGARGLWHTGGWPGWCWHSTYEYITFSTPGNGNYFGNATYRSAEGQGVSDGSRGVFSGGWPGKWDIEYVTINTPSNSKNFGNAWMGRFHCNTHITDGKKGVNPGGHSPWSPRHDIDYITIATPSNGTYFGSLRWHRFCNTGNTNGIKGFVIGGWWCPYGAIEVLTIATPGTSDYFGNIGNYYSHSASGGNGTYVNVAGGWGYGWCGWRQLRRFNTSSPQNADYFGNLSYHLHHFDSNTGN